jgi:hypothetical protein
MNGKEMRDVRSVVLRNVGRCRECGWLCSLPCQVCRHPKRLAAIEVRRQIALRRAEALRK